METNTPTPVSLLRLGGIAGICAGSFIICFVIIDGIVGGIFDWSIIDGGPVEPWINRILAQPQLAWIGISLPMLGFGSMLIVALVLYRHLPASPVLKTLALGGQLIGLPLAVYTFMTASSLVAFVISRGGELGPGSSEFSLLVARDMNLFMLQNMLYCPFFVMVVGNTAWSLAGFKNRAIPRGLAIWGILNGIMLVLALLSFIWPALRVFTLAGPLTMLWFISMGIWLLWLSTRNPGEPGSVAA
jgi:hypothetical protein